LISFAVQQSVLPTELSQTLLLVVALSMLATPLLFIVYDLISNRMNSNAPEVEADEIDEQTGIIIAGIGRFGQIVNRMLLMAGKSATVLDHDLQTIEMMRQFGFKGFFGDPTRPELLHAAGIDTARVLVVALDDKDAAVKLVDYVRGIRPDIAIVARARDRVHTYELYQAGADDIVREMFDSSLRAGRYVLERSGMTDFDAAELEHEFFKADRRGLLELAKLWDPKIPIRNNKAYVERAKELKNELETSFVAKSQQSQPDA
ncbi:MAG: NAD-binding protein, partial [Pseudomonadota bacterium]